MFYIRSEGYNYQFYKLLPSECLYFSDFNFNTNMMIMVTKMMTVIDMIHNYFRVEKTAFGSIINSEQILSSRHIDTRKINVNSNCLT
jgi:hypothetical protein